jgi:hypothetical protein
LISADFSRDQPIVIGADPFTAPTGRLRKLFSSSAKNHDIILIVRVVAAAIEICEWGILQGIIKLQELLPIS